VRREQRPAPEELTVPPSLRPAPARPAKPEKHERPHREPRGRSSGVWFTINVGRSKHADPKWLVPLLCRRGDVTKRAIGKIEILMKETRVEIAPDAAAHFAEAVRRPDTKDKNIHIERLDVD
jgi:ATP-dependent RNA helicase DeaD